MCWRSWSNFFYRRCWSKSSLWVVNKWETQTLRRLCHTWSLGIQASVYSRLGIAMIASGIGWSKKLSTWFWRISLVVWGEEATMVVIEPRRREMRGSWDSANFASQWWGFSPSWSSEPMMGRPVWPGGSFAMYDGKRKWWRQKQKSVKQSRSTTIWSSISLTFRLFFLPSSMFEFLCIY